MATEGVAVRLASVPRGWWGTMNMYFLDIGLVSSTAVSCAYNLDYGAVLCLLHVDDMLLSGSDDGNVLQVIEKLKGRLGRWTWETKFPSRYGNIPQRARRNH